MNKWMVIGWWCFIFISFGGIIYFFHLDSQKCDEHIILKDGTQYDCKDVTSLSNNMTYIVTCDDIRISFPTSNIKEVKRIK